MPPFPQPAFTYAYELEAQLDALREYRDTAPGRAIPPKSDGRLLLVTWNLANLGVQDRSDDDYRLIAEVLSWFDLAALQETNDDLEGLRGIQRHLPDGYRARFSGPAGNDERMAFVYDSTRVEALEEVGGVSVPPSDAPHVTLPGVAGAFQGFDRNPYLGSFRAGELTFLLVNVHLYYGGTDAKSIARRQLEAYAVGRWAARRQADPHSYAPNIVCLGDFNLPKTQPGDPVYDVLMRTGLTLPGHSTAIGSSIVGDEHYDQLCFVPGAIREAFTGTIGVFDYDGAVFRHLWETRPHDDFFAYVRYHLSDHRPMWAEFATAAVPEVVAAPRGP